MRTRRLGAVATVGVLGAGGLVAYSALFRPWHLRWGATREEAARPMPGDELVGAPAYVSTRAISIHAAPEDIWPWLVQIGMERAGFYSYRWMEQLAGVNVTTMEHLLPEFQNLEPGDVIPAGRGLHLPVRAVEPYGSLVLGARPEAPAGQSKVSWALGLYPAGSGTTRLVSRVRSVYRWRPGTPARALFFGPLHFLFERKMLHGIRRRAEADAARRWGPAEVRRRGPRAPSPELAPRPGTSPHA